MTLLVFLSYFLLMSLIVLQTPAAARAKLRPLTEVAQVSSSAACATLSLPLRRSNIDAFDAKTAYEAVPPSVPPTAPAMSKPNIRFVWPTSLFLATYKLLLRPWTAVVLIVISDCFVDRPARITPCCPSTKNKDNPFA